MAGAQEPGTVSTKQQRIAQIAKRYPERGLCTLSHYMDVEWLYEAYRRTRKDGAVGVDGQNAQDYAVNLDANLKSLLERAKSGSYQAPPVKRAYIPKREGAKELRLIGVPTFEDKILQRAIAMMLEPIYEQEFLNFSYGFRPRRSAHQALGALWKKMMDMGGGWVLDVDIRKYFDTIDHRHLRKILRSRVRDGVVLRLIDKWLKAGVLEAGMHHYSDTGTPQGGVISPWLSNIYLHEVLDKWIIRDVESRIRGQVFTIRFADDAVLGFSCNRDAERVMEVLPKRFEKYGLELHQEKSRLVEFQCPGSLLSGGNGGRTTESMTFNFLGFTHYWAKSRKGKWIIKRKTAKDRFNLAIKNVAWWCRMNRHLKIREQQEALSSKLTGHYSYYGITGNYHGLGGFYYGVMRTWKKWLNRRTRRGRNSTNWARFETISNRSPLPRPRIVHSIYNT